MHAQLFMILGTVASAAVGLAACAGWSKLTDDPLGAVPLGIFMLPALFSTAVLTAVGWWLTDIGWLTWV